MRRIVIAVSVALTVALLTHFFSLAHPTATNRTIKVTAHRFAFTPHTIHVQQGDRVTLTLSSEDVTHGLYIDGYNLGMHAQPGERASITFTADKTGKFPFRCAITCGNFHPYMVGRLIVGPNYLLVAGLWLAVLATWTGIVAALTRAGVVTW